NRQLGSQIAEYATANADRLGVDYGIWEQQIWHTRNRQWRQMNDRGDLTQNHYDHVHVSSLACACALHPMHRSRALSAPSAAEGAPTWPCSVVPNPVASQGERD